MKEAYGLLSQSIIRVEKDDIQMDSDNEDDAPGGPGGAGGANANDDDEDEDDDDDNDAGGKGGVNPSSSAVGPTTSPSRAQAAVTTAVTPAPAPTVKRVKTAITYDKYMKMMELIVTHLAAIERSTGEGMKKSDVMNWYLEEIENELRTVEDLERERSLVEKVVAKLIKVSVVFFLCLSIVEAREQLLTISLHARANRRNTCSNCEEKD